MLKTGYHPKMDEERLVIGSESKRKLVKVNPVIFRQILRAQEAVREVYMDEKLKIYLGYYFATRYPEKI
jgi:hypothetical protein